MKSEIFVLLVRNCNTVTFERVSNLRLDFVHIDKAVKHNHITLAFSGFGDITPHEEHIASVFGHGCDIGVVGFHAFNAELTEPFRC